MPSPFPGMDPYLDIQLTFTRAYDQGRHHRWIRYDQPPAPTLSPEDRAWAEGLLRQAGLLD